MFGFSQPLSRCILLGLEPIKPCIFDKLIERLDREHFASGREDHFFHVFTTNAETSPTYAGDNLIFWIVCRIDRQGSTRRGAECVSPCPEQCRHLR